LAHGQAVARLAAAPQLDMDAAEISAALDELIALGMLEGPVPVSALDFDWLASFHRFAETTGASQGSAAVLAALDALRRIAGEFGEAGAGERQTLLDAAKRHLAFDGDVAAPAVFVGHPVFRRPPFAFQEPPP